MPTTCARTPGQVSFPGGTIDPGETPSRRRCARPRRRSASTPRQIEVFGELPELWLPPSNFAVTPVLGYWRERGEVGVVSPDEVHEIHHVADRASCSTPSHRITVRHPSGWLGPGFLIGPGRDVILWGFTAGIIARLFDFLGWSSAVGHRAGA